ncbi:MAG: hypothetical protein K940chlam5_00814 [Candidatus Anoxychlamydiales bacterium]|nr:hypothetical protein [Candidatus Anoxychlamydiales bacterium]
MSGQVSGSLIGLAYETIGRPVVGRFKKSPAIDDKKGSIDTSLTDNERSILGQKKAVAITLDGYVYDTAERINSLGSRIILEDLSAYLDIKIGLQRLIDGTEATSADTKLIDKLSVDNFFRKFAVLEGQKQDSQPLNDIIDRAEGYITEISDYIDIKLNDTSPLSKEEKEKHYSHISSQLDILKETLINAAIELGQIESLLGKNDYDSVTQYHIGDFNEVFRKGYELNARFEGIKNKNASSHNIRKLAAAEASSKAKRFLKLLSDPYYGRLITYGLSYGIPRIYNAMYPEGQKEGDTTAEETALFWAILTGVGPAIGNAVQSQLFKTFIVDETCIRFPLWLMEKKVPDIFNFSDGQKLRFGPKAPGKSGREIIEGMRKKAAIESFTKKIEKGEGEISQKDIELSKLHELHDAIGERLNNFKSHGTIFGYLNPKSKKGPVAFSEQDDADFIHKLNHQLRSDFYTGWEPEDKNEKGEFVIVKLNNGIRYQSDILDQEKTLEFIADHIAIKINNLLVEIEDSEQSIDKELFVMEGKGIEPGVDRSRTLQTNSRKPLFAQDSFEKYTKAAKNHFFSKLNEARIENDRFDLKALDKDTKNFLTQLCENYSEQSQKGFENAVKQEFDEAIRAHPIPRVMDAIEYLAKGYRKS